MGDLGVVRIPCELVVPLTSVSASDGAYVEVQPDLGNARLEVHPPSWVTDVSIHVPPGWSLDADGVAQFESSLREARGG